jgi:hypothetical protein
MRLAISTPSSCSFTVLSVIGITHHHLKKGFSLQPSAIGCGPAKRTVNRIATAETWPDAGIRAGGPKTAADPLANLSVDAYFRPTSLKYFMAPS